MNSNHALDGAAALAGPAAPTPHWGLIRATGPDAGNFLHGQLTNDFAALGPTEARLAAYCSPKGRMLASFVAWRSTDDEILLACHPSVLAATVKRLSMFVMRAKCKLSDASADWSVTGLVGSAAESAGLALAVWQHTVVGAVHWIRLPDAAGLQRVVRVEAAGGAAPAATLGLADWRWLELQSGIATIEAATADQFVPQMLNYELVGGVNFQKGCYPGQEIVARSQYRGTVKRRTFLYDCDAIGIAAGAEVYEAADPSQPAGMVANGAARPGGGSSALVEVKLTAVDGSLHVGSVDGPVLHARPMPYVPLAATDVG